MEFGDLQQRAWTTGRQEALESAAEAGRSRTDRQDAAADPEKAAGREEADGDPGKAAATRERRWDGGGAAAAVERRALGLGDEERRRTSVRGSGGFGDFPRELGGGIISVITVRVGVKADSLVWRSSGSWSRPVSPGSWFYT